MIGSSFATPATHCFSRWLGIRIDMISGIFAGSLAFYLIYGVSKPDPSSVGFTMAMAGTPHDAITLSQTTKHVLIVSFTDMAVMCVRIYNEFESTSIPLSSPDSP